MQRSNPEQTGKKHVPPQFLCSEPSQTPGNGKGKVLRKPGFLIRLLKLWQCNSQMLARVSWGHHGHMSLGLLHGPPLTRADMQQRFRVLLQALNRPHTSSVQPSSPLKALTWEILTVTLSPSQQGKQKWQLLPCVTDSKTLGNHRPHEYEKRHLCC